MICMNVFSLFLTLTAVYVSCGIVTFGERKYYDVLSLDLNGTIPEYKTRYVTHVTPNIQPDLVEQNFTFLNVTFINRISKVTVEYDPGKMYLSFFIPLPFEEISFQLKGYSMPLQYF